jgi:hypothetical protein
MHSKLPPHLWEYLMNDPMAQQKRAELPHRLGGDGIYAYLEELERVSGELRAWISRLRGGQQMISVAEAFGMDLRFTVTSALGCQSHGAELESQWEPYRVLDPLFWALELHSEKT